MKLSLIVAILGLTALPGNNLKISKCALKIELLELQNYYNEKQRMAENSPLSLIPKHMAGRFATHDDGLVAEVFAFGYVTAMKDTLDWLAAQQKIPQIRQRVVK